MVSASHPGAHYLLVRSNVESKWKDEEAGSYHYGTTVPNHTKVVPGAEFLLDRKFADGVRIIGRGQIGEVRPDAGDGQHFRATFATYQHLKPPRVVTPEIQERLRA